MRIRLKTSVLVATLFCGAAYAAQSLLQEEYNRRDQIQFTGPQGAALAFLRNAQYPTENIVEFETLEQEGQFLVRDKDDKICLGNYLENELRCVNKAGIKQQVVDGESD